MLSYNNADSVRTSVGSLLPLGFEIIICDNKSSDGTETILDGYSKGEGIRVVSAKCTRGKGRQLAFEASTGDYILSHMDCDDTFSVQGIKDLVSVYHEKYEGIVMMTKQPGDSVSNVTICPRRLVEEIGGWRDLNWNEDWDFWERAAEQGKYSFAPYPQSSPPHRNIRSMAQVRRTSVTRKIASRFGKYYDAYRIGRPPFTEGEHVSQTQRAIAWVARANLTLRRSKLSPVRNRDFNDMQVTALNSTRPPRAQSDAMI